MMLSQENRCALASPGMLRALTGFALCWVIRNGYILGTSRTRLRPLKCESLTLHSVDDPVYIYYAAETIG